MENMLAATRKDSAITADSVSDKAVGNFGRLIVCGGMPRLWAVW